MVASVNFIERKGITGKEPEKIKNVTIKYANIFSEINRNLQRKQHHQRKNQKEVENVHLKPLQIHMKSN